MATIEVTLSEAEVRHACEHWAITRILNEGRALSSEITVTVWHGQPTGTLNSCKVWVETDACRNPTEGAAPVAQTDTYDDGGPWYRCGCGQIWQAPGHPRPRDCPECENDRRVEEFFPPDDQSN